MKTLIKNGLVVDPANGLKEVRDILMEDGKISNLSKEIRVKADLVIEAVGKVIIPGLVDMHVHLREPGREDKENISSGTNAALKGGVTSVLAMPNTIPAIDSKENVLLLKSILGKGAKIEVLISGAITKGRQGKELADFSAMKQEGVVAITDDGASVDDEGLFLKALQKAKKEELLVICHSEDKELSGHGVINRGFIATRMGLRGISNESEYLRVKRDIRLAQESGARIHIAHVSCRESVELIAAAKKTGILVTAETAPHYFALTEKDVLGYDTNMKMNPPLRSEADLLAIKEGLKNGTIDAIASDHAPHTEYEKDIEFDRAEFGVIGLETELSVAITELLETGILDWFGLVEKLSLNPAKILGLDKGTLSLGQFANLGGVDPSREWAVKKEGFLSKSKNSAFLGRRLKGVVEYTFCAGELAYKHPG